MLPASARAPLPTARRCKKVRRSVLVIFVSLVAPAVLPPVVFAGPYHTGGKTAGATVRALQFDLPALPEQGLHPFVGILVVGDLHPGGVPQQLAFVVCGDGAQHQPLRVRTSNAETGAGRRSTLAGADPVAAMRGMVVAETGAGGTLQVGIGELVLRPFRARQQAHAFPAATGPQIALGADEDAVVSGPLGTTAPATATPPAAGLLPSTARSARRRDSRSATGRSARTASAPAPSSRADLRPRTGNLARLFGRHTRRKIRIPLNAVTPVHCDRRQIPASAELVPDGVLHGVREGTGPFALDALDADQTLGAQLQRPVGRTQDVDTPIAEQTAAEIEEAAPVERHVETELRCSATAAAPTHRRRREFLVVVVAFGVRSRRRAAQPEIPIQRVGNRHLGRDLLHALGPSRIAMPVVNFLHLDR